MAIQTLDQYIAAAKQRITLMKTASRTSVAAMPFSLFDLAGNPGAGVFEVGNIVNGIVPANPSIAGYPTINAFGGGNIGYISSVDFGCSVACRMVLFDRVFSAGSFLWSGSYPVVLTAQPSYAGRLPNTDYKGLEIWAEVSVLLAGASTAVTVTYTDDADNAGRTTGAITLGALTLGRMVQLPLQAGDKGVKKIESITLASATAGSVNIHVMRRLWMGRVAAVAAGDNHDMLKTGLVQIYSDSALFLQQVADSTATGIPELQVEICNG